MSIFWVEHDAPPPPPPLLPPLSLSLSLHLTPPVFPVPSLFFLFLHLFLRESNYVEAEQKSRRQFLSLPARARAHARLWDGENLERVHRGRNHEGTLVPLLWVCLRDLRGLLFLALFIVKHAQVWGSSSFHFRSLFFPTLTFFFFFLGC